MLRWVPQTFLVSIVRRVAAAPLPGMTGGGRAKEGAICDRSTDCLDRFAIARRSGSNADREVAQTQNGDEAAGRGDGSAQASARRASSAQGFVQLGFASRGRLYVAWALNR